MTTMENLVSNVSDVVLNATTSTMCNGSCMTPVSQPAGRTIYDDVLDGLEYVNIAMLPTCLVLGVLGNMITLIIMNTKAFSSLTSRYFLMSLAVSDCILLLTQPFNKIIVIKYFQRDFRALSDAGCKIYFWLFKSGKMTSSWFVVFLCLERFTAVQFPFRFKTVFRKRNCLIAVAIVYSVMAIFNGAWAYASKITNDGICHPDEYDKADPSAVALFNAMLTAGSCLYSLIPIIILVTVTPVIIINLVRRSYARKKMAENKGKDMDIIRITSMLLAVAITYVLLVAPVTVMHNVAFYLGMHAFGENPKPFLIYRDVSQILEQLNYTINFFLYVASNRQFRIGVVQLLHLNSCKCLKPKPRTQIRRQNHHKALHEDKTDQSDNVTPNTQDSIVTTK